ncbi:hypothetical protein AB1Y20_019681 [Prymnesium parvum]|uniref:Ubiquitin-like domain-containing protein n=1 Tax=Prymnesium parvum TaxID=97485 RepID=A0AB34JUQ9_PRYPA
MSSKSIHVQLRVLAGVGSVEQGNYKGSTTVSELLASHPGHDLIMDHKLMVCVPSVGTRFAVSISWDDTATDIKRKIEELAKLSAEHQVLSADGVIFEGDERLLATMSDMARPSINLEVKGASEGEESEFLRDHLPDIAATGRSIEILSPESTLADLGLVDSCTLYVMPRRVPTIQVVLPMDRGTAPIELSSSDMSVGDLKAAIALAHGFDPSAVRLVFSGRQLKMNSKLLSALGIIDESIVTVLPSLNKTETILPLEEPAKPVSPVSNSASHILRCAVLGSAALVALIVASFKTWGAGRR